MEDISEILNFLQGVGFNGTCVTEVKDLTELINDGPKSSKFRELVTWITNEVRVLANIDEKISSDSEINDFMIELSGFLKEMQCPFQSFITGPVSQRLQTVDSRLILLDYLLTELMAMKMYHKLKPKENVVIEVSESRAAAALKSIATTLNIGKPPNNVPVNIVFEKINTRLTEVLQKAGPNQLGKPLFSPTKQLTESQWKTLEKLRKDLDAEYDIRRQMLITRLDVTIQSFQWSDKTRGKEDKIAARYTANRNFLDSIQSGGHRTDLMALLAARDDVAIIEKTSSANVRKNTHTSIQKHVIGRVPDRGGRAYEHAPPPPEMPFWQKRTADSGGGGGRGGGRGGFGSSQPQRGDYQGQNSGGNRQSGGYQQKSGNYQQQQGNYQNQQSGNYQKPGGNYQQQGGNYQQQGGNYQQQGGNYQNQSGGFGNNRGTGRVQGGWSQAGAQNYEQQQTGNNRQNSGGFNRGGNDSNSGNFNNERGQSNYRRGGRR